MLGVSRPEAVNGMGGLADLCFAVRQGRTRLARLATRPPLQVGRALYLDDASPAMAFVTLANPTAGIFAGDRLRVAVEVLAGAQAHVTTQAATKVHTMAGGAAEQETALAVADGAYLEFAPGALIPFAGARFTQRTTLRVAPGGVAVYAEMLLPGRLAMGESLAYEHLASDLTVLREDEHPVYRESFSLTPARAQEMGVGMFGGAGGAVIGTLIAVTPPSYVDTLLGLLRGVAAAHPLATAGAGALPGRAGAALKALGPDSAAVSALLQHGLAAVRAACRTTFA